MKLTKAEAAFQRWLAEGPKLAKAVGLFVGIKVMSEDDPEAVKSRRALNASSQPKGNE